MVVRLQEKLGPDEVQAALLDLMDAADALERDLGLDPGAVIHELTSLLQRRRQFETLRRDYDVRPHGGRHKWQS